MIDVLKTLILGMITVLLVAMFPMAFCIVVIASVIIFIISLISFGIEKRTDDKFFESEVK